MSAYRSFFVGLGANKFSISDGEQLWQLLAQITLRKLFRQVTRHKADKRAVGRDVTLHLRDGSLLPVPNREPLPEEAAIAADELKLLFEQLPVAARRVVELRLQGEELTAIASELDISERTVRRWLETARVALTARRAEFLHGQNSSSFKRPRSTKRPTQANNGVLNKSPAQSSVRRYAPELLESKTELPPLALLTLNYSDYVLQRMIGAGASGKVYRARSVRDGKHYALKFLRKSFITQPRAVERFLTEFSLISQLRHRHLMPVHGCGRTSVGIYFFAMELASGDLQREIDRRRIPIGQALAWLREAAQGVRHAHRRGIVHCDLKPSNLVLSREKRILVSDFGLATRADDPSRNMRVAGTPAFMAPEQISSAWGEIGAHTDVYGLGATFYVLLTGQLPFDGNRPADVLTAVVSEKEPIAPRTLRRSIPEAVSHVCLRCLSKRPADRFPTVDALLRTMGKLRL